MISEGVSKRKLMMKGMVLSYGTLFRVSCYKCANGLEELRASTAEDFGLPRNVDAQHGVVYEMTVILIVVTVMSSYLTKRFSCFRLRLNGLRKINDIDLQ